MPGNVTFYLPSLSVSTQDKEWSNWLSICDVHQYNKRRKNYYHLQRVKTNWGTQTFSYLSLNDFNTLPSAVIRILTF
jgi:hypothetical protein